MQPQVDKKKKNFNTHLLYGLLIFAGIMMLAVPLLLRKQHGGDGYPFKLPPLPYAYNALEPYIDELTMQLHHNKHHQAYIDNLNAALKDQPELQKKTVEQLLQNIDALPEKVRTAIRNNGGGHYNHSFFWKIMAPHTSEGHAKGEPLAGVKELIDKNFTDFKTFKEEFDTAAKKVFGSGWAWLVLDSNGKPHIITTPNQDSPISQGLTPLLGLDVWEHAYYLKYHNVRPEYIDAWWNVVNWKAVEDNYNWAKEVKSSVK